KERFIIRWNRRWKRGPLKALFMAEVTQVGERVASDALARRKLPGQEPPAAFDPDVPALFVVVGRPGQPVQSDLRARHRTGALVPGDFGPPVRPEIGLEHGEEVTRITGFHADPE